MYENLQTIIATVSTSVVEQRIRGGTSEIQPKRLVINFTNVLQSKHIFMHFFYL